MRIIDNNKKNKKTFNDLSLNDVFKMAPISPAYSTKDVWLKTNNCGSVNAVCLSSGLCGLFNGTEEVIGPFSAELHIL